MDRKAGGQALIELLIGALALMVFLFLVYDLSKTTLKEQQRYHFSAKTATRRFQ